ncbi:hypothetical protein OW763_13960 [Clostridium aestuarii]|uniref:DUF4767 domain-containing protein n=1 Tax=Clostridium aestuarii TaxID=338193 RepID=A0ABT4D5F9_9CLOT|nr:hypothetical protein [Clostridium aestuarii]MCY6485435.1 hypothetical protein [Clostridium aestuarii]
MKKFKYLIILFVVFLSLLHFYENYIYYKIPHNPLTEISQDIPKKCYFTEYYSNNEIDKTSHNSNTNALIFKYFKNLKLIPLKERNEETCKHETDDYFSYWFQFYSESDSYYIFITEIFKDNLTVISIRSDKPRFPNGYYKISDSKFDYNYVNNLIINSEN